MKKRFASMAILCSVLLLGLSACGKKAPPKAPEKTAATIVLDLKNT